MAVKTHFSDRDFERILSTYDLGPYIRSEAVSEGTVQTNFFVQTGQGKIVFRYYENRSTESVLFESDLLTYLTERDYPCPAPLKNRQGEIVGMHCNKPYVIFEFMPGRPVEQPTPRHKAQLIQKVAELQALTKDFQSAYTPHRWNYGPDLCRTLAQAEATKINTQDAAAKFAWLAQELSTLQFPPSLPKGICHCDFHFSNVLFHAGQFAALLDFDDANYTFLPFDLVGLIEAWAWPGQAPLLDLAQAHNIVQAYRQYRPLSPPEAQHVFDVYKLSILMDCIWYFSRGPANDFFEKRKIEALTKLGRERFWAALFS